MLIPKTNDTYYIRLLSMSLCGPCTSIFRGNPLTPGVYYDHHPSWASFVAAAHENCEICWRRFDALDADQQACLRRFAAIVGNNPSITASAVGLAVRSSGYVHVEFTYNLAVEAMNQRGKGLIDFSTNRELDGISDFLLRRCQKLPFLPSDIGKSLVMPITEKSTSSASTWDLVLSWLDDRSSHRRCTERRGDPNWYPSRLLDILASELETFKIVDGHSILPGSSYLTLSHRWGSETMPRLTIANMPFYQAGAPISELPPTFQDTITIARRLGSRYIWIDSLCIIQEGDGGQDWMREAPQMAYVYSKSLLNISADWGTGKQGLFFDRKCDFSNKFELHLCLTSGKQKRGRKRQRITERAMYTYIPTFHLEQVDDSPLAGRGWVFQERILSPAIIHFGRREVLWECCQNLASESLPYGIPNIPHNDMGSLSQSTTLKRLDPSGDPHLSHLLSQSFGASLTDSTVRDTPYLLWWFLVRKYCQCALTYAKDRLVAISGVARYFKSIIKDQHIVGMWRKYLAIEMGWTVKSAAFASQDSLYRGPSFSWTSVGGVIEPGNPVYDTSLSPCVEVEPVEVSTAEETIPGPVLEDIFGPLTEPCVRIRVKGDLKSAWLRHNAQQWFVRPMDEADGDKEEVQNFQGVRAQLDFVPSETEEEDLQRRMFFYMPWYTYSNGSATCFMLLDLKDRRTREFRRVGVCKTVGFRAHEFTEVLLRAQPSHHLLPGFDEITRIHTVYIL
ncbi:heterokaryon incompatibility protein-domain-containing protein [Xylaria palmicola]|nr:heterokaryon incompatibility protein-domain-containing protein [Xylaria palmicola]